MKVAGDYRFEAPRETVWEALLDPAVLAATMPGCEKLELTGENRYEGALDIKIGPVQGKFQGRVELGELAAPTGYTMKVDGRGAPGFVNATATIRLEEDGSGTRLLYDGDAQVGGRIASVGQRLLDSSARSIIRQSLEGLGATLAARQAAASAPTGEGGAEALPSMPKAPTQTQVAARVARDVAADLVPKSVWIALAIVIVLVLLYFLLR